MGNQPRLAITVGRDSHYFPGTVVVFPDDSCVRVWKNGTDGKNWRAEGGTVQFSGEQDSILVGSSDMRRGPTVEVRLLARDLFVYSASPVNQKHPTAFAFLPDWAAARLLDEVNCGENQFFRAALLEEWLAKESGRVTETLDSLMKQHAELMRQGGWTHRLDEPFRNAIERLLCVPLREIEGAVREMKDPVRRLAAFKALRSGQSIE